MSEDCKTKVDNIIKKAKLEHKPLKDKIQKLKSEFKEKGFKGYDVDTKVYKLVEPEYREFFETYHVKSYGYLKGCDSYYLPYIWNKLDPLFDEIRLYPIFPYPH